jgi:hypothetical protein
MSTVLVKKKNGNDMGSIVEAAAASNALTQPEHSPTILNASNHTMVVFQERGTFYNCQVLRPGEAVSMTVQQTGGFPLLPYRVHAIVGNETSLPSRRDSTKNLIKETAVPAAFIAGCFATAISAGMLVGPSVALAPLVSGMVVNGIVIDSTALAAGAVMSTRAGVVTDMILKDRPNHIFAKTDRLKPGRRYLVVAGGLDDGPVKIDEVKKGSDTKFEVTVFKGPLNNGTLQDSGVFVDNDNVTENVEKDEIGLLEDKSENKDEEKIDVEIKKGYKFGDITKSIVGGFRK